MNSRLATVEECTNAMEAHILAGRLEAEGIRTFIADEHHIWVNWFMSQALHGVKVQVDLENLEQAKAVLRQIEQGAFAADEPETCPVCGGKAEFTWSWSRRVALLALWLVTLPLPYSRRETRCKRCGRELER